MKITEHLLKISGVEYGTNSNSYAVIYDEGIILIDCGYRTEQWERMCTVLENWNLDMSDVTHVFLTHGHFDHGGNAWRVNAMGAKLLTSKADTRLIEEGNPESEQLFGSKWIPAKVDQVIHDGDQFDFPGGVRITVMETPGHSAGSLSYLIEVDRVRALCTGDMFWPVPVPPQDKVDVELGFTGSWDFDWKAFVDSLGRLASVDLDILLPGHYYFYRGRRASDLIASACEYAKKWEENL